jgi:hypothetical protein
VQVAKANELKENALPVLTARVSETELEKWFPFEFHRMTHPQEVPEPSKAALVRLETGDYFVLFWGELSKQLMLRIPATTDASDFLAAFFKEVPLPRRRILWRRSDARLPRHIAAKRIAVPRRTK